MLKKNIVITILITLFVGSVLFLSILDKKLLIEADTYYEVYLEGKNIGTILDDSKLYALIDANQVSIKNKYGVTNVYPPTDLKVIKTNSFKNHSSNIEDVYKEIERNNDFTIKGYVVTIKNENKTYTLNILDKEVFYNAAKRFVNAFLDANEYDNYINNTQSEIESTGHIIENMYFKDNITIKEGYISVKDKIYTDEVELSQFLLFGSNPNTKHYTVKLGDTIDSISEENKLNSEEFLIANPSYKSSNTLLRVGDNVNVTLIQPELTFVYDLYEISDEYVYYTKESKYDATKPIGFREVTIAGQNGINRVTEKYSVTNGEREQGVDPIKIELIREARNQVTTIGTRNDNPLGGGIPVYIEGDWGWPTNQGYVITSYYGWRWGAMHSGIDISGAGNFGSSIYAASDGVVIKAFNGCPSRGYGLGDSCGGQLGNSIIIDHGNGYYTMYGHMHQNLKVSVGQSVKKGQLIGYMGNSGSSTGPHLHFAVSKGSTTSYFNPLSLYR